MNPKERKPSRGAGRQPGEWVTESEACGVHSFEAYSRPRWRCCSSTTCTSVPPRLAKASTTPSSSEEAEVQATSVPGRSSPSPVYCNQSEPVLLLLRPPRAAAPGTNRRTRLGNGGSATAAGTVHQCVAWRVGIGSFLAGAAAVEGACRGAAMGGLAELSSAPLPHSPVPSSSIPGANGCARIGCWDGSVCDQPRPEE
jgi:hypothetical protein